MNRFCMIVVFISLIHCSLRSQVIRVNNGISISSFTSGKVDVLNHKINLYAVILGMDYLDKPFYNLSTEVGYIGIGGLDEVLVVGNISDLTDKIKLKEYKKYVHLNTTFRLKYTKYPYNAYLGLGPKLDILTANNKFNYIGYEMYELNNFVYGFKSELGINRLFENRLLCGLNISYFYHLNHFAKSSINKLGNTTFAITLAIGYRL